MKKTGWSRYYRTLPGTMGSNEAPLATDTTGNFLPDTASTRSSQPIIFKKPKERAVKYRNSFIADFSMEDGTFERTQAGMHTPVPRRIDCTPSDFFL